MAKEVVVTREGYQKLEQDLNELRTVNVRKWRIRSRSRAATAT